MLKNYFKVAWRNLIKHKLFSAINILGLAAGMTVCMLALMKIKAAYDYDTFHPQAERSYRIITRLARQNGEHLLAASSPLALGNYLKKAQPEIESCTRIYFLSGKAQANEKSLFVKQGYTDKDFYKMFGFRLQSGGPAIGPQTAVLTAATASLYFGNADPVGKTIHLEGSGDFIISGVLAKPRAPSHLKFDVLAAMPVEKGAAAPINWTDEAACYTYVQLKAGTSVSALSGVLRGASNLANQQLPAGIAKTLAFESQPLNSIVPAMKPMHHIANEIPFRNLMAFAGIGLAILLLAFFNYINLTLARSLDRAREVGVRKVAGAVRRQLMLQFLCESVVTAALALLAAFAMLRVISGLPAIRRLTLDVVQDGKLWLWFVLFTAFTGLVAGWIPARVLSSFQPVRVLKGGRFNVRLFGGVGLRKTMTVLQFALSLAALITLMVFYRQSHFMATADYGFNRERILNIPVDSGAYNRMAAALGSVSGVEEVSAASALFGFSGSDTRFIKTEAGPDSIGAAYYAITPSLLRTMALPLVAGKNLPQASVAGGATFVLVNEATCRRLRFSDPSDAVGKEIRLTSGDTAIISGVLADFHYNNFQGFIGPLLLANDPSNFSTLQLKIAAGAEQSVLPRVKAVLKTLYAHRSIEMAWYKQTLYDQHRHEDDIAFIGLLTGMALSIACLGLLGMVVYATKNRAKEVGIRKVMGAGVWQIIVVVAKEFFILLLLAVCIGLPVGYLLGTKFLQQYAYRINISAALLASGGAALLLLGVLTIAWQTYRTAVANPIKSLRTE